MKNYFKPKVRIILTQLLFLMILLAGNIFAASTFSGTGNWNNPARWDAGIPDANTDAIIAAGSNCTINVAAVCKSLFLNSGTPSTVSISESNSLTVSGDVTINNTSDNSQRTVLVVGSGTLSAVKITIFGGNGNRFG